MKVATLSTLWDYINRAMPWNQPKSLTSDQVYAVTAYMLNLGNVVPDDFVLSDRNMAEVQQRMPNRNGMSTAHALWPGREFGGSSKPDIQGSSCMRNCVDAPAVMSSLPDFARNQHGNLAEQNRAVGAQRGADTSLPEARAGTPVAAVAPTLLGPAAAAAPSPEASGRDNKPAQALATKLGCTGCHGMGQRIVGPSFAEIAKRHAGKVEYLAQKIRTGGAGVWGPIPMPAQALSETESKTIAAWIAAGAGK